MFIFLVIVNSNIICITFIYVFKLQIYHISIVVLTIVGDPKSDI